MFQKLPKLRANNFFQKGFTLIELLIVTAILAILLVIVLARFGTFGGQVDLNTASQRVLSALQLARNQTLASENETVYGIHFETSKYVLFRGSTYDSLDTNNIEYDLSSTSISAISLDGDGSEVIFDRIRGTTSQNGSVTIQLLSDTSKTQTIIISTLGQVSLQETVSPDCPGASCPRVIDTRHIHLLLGFDLATKTTMTLTFSDPCGSDVTEDITIADYTSGSKFNWESPVTMCFDDQKLRIHSHALSPDTTLSVHRDRRYNDKALNIDVDNADIVTYDAQGVATPGGIINQLIIQ